MATNGVHFMALDKARSRLAATEEEYKAASKQLDEAIKMGDLKENAEYDAAKASVAKIAKERDELMPVTVMPVVRSNDNISIIEEGSIIHLVIYSITQLPVKPGTSEFQTIKSQTPVFDGVLMYGATLRLHELLVDNALASDTPVGEFILGKQPGDYSIAVPAGFANVTVEKLKSDTKPEELYCKL